LIETEFSAAFAGLRPAQVPMCAGAGPASAGSATPASGFSHGGLASNMEIPGRESSSENCLRACNGLQGSPEQDPAAQGRCPANGTQAFMEVEPAKNSRVKKFQEEKIAKKPRNVIARRWLCRQGASNLHRR
jgi:hypothetical protein